MFTNRNQRKANLLRMAGLFAVMACHAVVHAQDELSRLFRDSTETRQPVKATFKSGQLVNAQSSETLYKHELWVDIVHKFDDIGGAFGGVKTFFGLDVATDVKIGFDYGLTDRLTVGIARAKGAPEEREGAVPFNSLTELWEGTMKWRAIRQTSDDHIPLSVTLYGNAVVSSRAALEDSSSDAHFQAAGERWGFMGQGILARKFNTNFSLALSASWLRRNLVAYQDRNNLFALGIGCRIKFTRRMAVIVDYFHPFRDAASRGYYKLQGIRFYDPLGVGLELETGGHVFHINFSNAPAVLENQFIPYTTRSWTRGEFRLAFNVGRSFTLGGKR
jgi:uncharacterized beta barrel domain-containing protein DUF5777